MALKKKENPEGDFERVMSKVDAVAAEKPKTQPKKKAKKEEAPQADKEGDLLGRDFSFDEEAQFQPVQKFTKNTA